MSYSRRKSVQMGPGQSGLVGTLGFTLLNADGTVNTARTTAGVIELAAGSGLYAATVTFPSGFVGDLVWDTGGASPKYASESINPATEEYPGLLGSILPSGAVTFVSPVLAGGSPAPTIQGMAYRAADGLAYLFPVPTAPSLASATITLTIYFPAAAQVFGCTFTGSGTGQQVQIELTSAQTSLMQLGRWKFLIAATLADGNTVPLADGTWPVAPN